MKLTGPLAAGLLLAFAAAPLLAVAYLAISPAAYLQVPPHGVSGRWFVALLDSPDLLEAAVRSVLLAGAVAIAVPSLALAAALGLEVPGTAGRRLLAGGLLAPPAVPEVVLAVAMVGAFLPLGFRGSLAVLFLAHAVVAMPFAFGPIAAALAARDRDLEAAAETLGATPCRVLLTVTLPALRPALAAVGALCFLVSFDQFTLSLFLTGPESTTLPVAVYDHLAGSSDPSTAAISTLMTLIGVLIALSLGRNGRGLVHQHQARQGR